MSKKYCVNSPARTSRVFTLRLENSMKIWAPLIGRELHMLSGLPYRQIFHTKRFAFFNTFSCYQQKCKQPWTLLCLSGNDSVFSLLPCSHCQLVKYSKIRRTFGWHFTVNLLRQKCKESEKNFDADELATCSRWQALNMMACIDWVLEDICNRMPKF